MTPPPASAGATGTAATFAAAKVKHAGDVARFWIERDWALVAMAQRFRGAAALEPGGPSGLFEAYGLIPVYPRLGRLDVLDYAERTLWTQPEVTIKRGRRKPPTRRVIAEAGNLDAIETGSYDAVLASHVIEHLANPVAAMRQWSRVVGPDGHVLLVVPHLEGTFDHRRPVTTVAHMRADAEAATGEDDRTHLEEVLALHDLERDPGSPDRATFERRTLENLEHRSVHHHTFTTASVAELCAAAGLTVVTLRAKLPFNIVCLCRASGGRALSRERLAAVLRASPFEADKAARA